MTNYLSTCLKKFFEIVLMVDLAEYKTQRVEKILGVNLNYLDEVPILSEWGQDALNTAKYILETSYESMDKLTTDLNKLKSDVDWYTLWD